LKQFCARGYAEVQRAMVEVIRRELPWFKTTESLADC